MTGGFEDGYGSGHSPQAPADGSDEERELTPEIEATGELTDDRQSAEDIPRHSRPFRAWGAAQERERPSIWERFTTWLRSVFSRKKEDDDGEADELTPDEKVPVVATSVPRTSFDDLDAPWTEDPYPVAERRSSRPSAERPTVEDFATNWDGTYGREEETEAEAEPEAVIEAVIEQETEVGSASDSTAEAVEDTPAFDAPPAADADALWDAPAVSSAASAPPPTLEAQDFADVWTPRDEAPAPEPAAEEEPPRKGFFARLFSRKAKPKDESLEEQEREAAAAWETDLNEAAEERAAEREPADADFAEDVAASAAPAPDDFSEPSLAAPPAADDFADDPGTTESVEVVASVESTESTESVESVEVVSIDAFVEEAPAAEPEEERYEEPITEPEPPPKRLSFIGRLFGRKSKETAAAAVDHSPEDAANLAAILGATPVITPAEAEAPEVEEAETGEPAVDELAIEEREIEQPEAEAAEAFALPEDEAPTEVIAVAAEVTFEPIEEPPAEEEQEPIAESLTLDGLPEPDFAEPAEAPLAMPEADTAKKPGFFSSLLKRVSRSMFVPKTAAQPEPLPEMDIAASASIDEEIQEEVAVIEAPAEPAPEDDLAAKWGPPETVDEPPAVEEVEPEPIEAVEPEPIQAAAPHVEPELESTQPFPAFRDARDDFADEAPAVEGGRPTEKVEIPEFEEGEKTDEFEAVPAVAAEDAGESTAETKPVSFWGRLFGRKDAATSGEGVVPAVEDKTPFVLAKFRIFYNEIIRDKHQKSDVISGFATAVLSAPAADMADPEFAAQLLSKRLSEMLELQAAESNWTGGDAAKYYPEAQYAMVALADETFATVDWPGRSHWHKHMLEPRMYGTRAADIEFFKRIDKMLKDGESTQGSRDLARLYLMVIASGFRGKYRIPNVKRPLAEYRRRLYEYSHQRDPLELYARDRRIFPEAVKHTLTSRAVGRFTSAQKWVAVVLLLAALYLGVSHYAWARLSLELEDVTSRIKASISQQPPR